METTPKIHLCFVAYEYLDRFSSVSDLLDDFFSLTDVAEALVREGFQVSAVVRYHQEEQLERGGVNYYFVADSYGPKLAFWQIPKLVHRIVQAIRPDIVHTHNMNKVLQHNHLVSILGARIPIVVQNHAEWPAKRLRMMIQRLLFPKLSAFLFCAPGQEAKWRQLGLIPNNLPIYYVMEGSTEFEIKDRSQAREKTGLSGNPIFLWVGNLDSNKDPLTVLMAFEQLLLDVPEAHLYMIYRFDRLLPATKELIGTSAGLSKAVTLLGIKTRAELEDFYNSANYFVLGSHQEGSGYSLMESLACGCVPIVTDIPSFRMMTDAGELGALWSCGDHDDACRAMNEAVRKPWKAESKKARQLFNNKLSNTAIAKQLKMIYQELLIIKRP